MDRVAPADEPLRVAGHGAEGADPVTAERRLVLAKGFCRRVTQVASGDFLQVPGDQQQSLVGNQVEAVKQIARHQQCQQTQPGGQHQPLLHGCKTRLQQTVQRWQPLVIKRLQAQQHGLAFFVVFDRAQLGLVDQGFMVCRQFMKGRHFVDNRQVQLRRQRRVGRSGALQIGPRLLQAGLHTGGPHQVALFDINRQARMRQRVSAPAP